MAAWQQFADEVLSVASDYVRSGGLSVSVKTNLGPEFTVARSSLSSSGGSGSSGGSSGGPGLIDLLGIKAAVIVRDRSGNRIATYGEVPSTSYVHAAALIGVVVLLGVVIVRGVLK